MPANASVISAYQKYNGERLVVSSSIAAEMYAKHHQL